MSEGSRNNSQFAVLGVWREEVRRGGVKLLAAAEIRGEKEGKRGSIAKVSHTR